MNRSCSAALSILFLAYGAAYAQGNMSFLTDSPIEKMTKEDIALLVKHSNEALSTNENGHTSGWTNPKTGASGTITPLTTFTQRGTTCRRTEYTNAAGGFKGRSEYTLCRAPTGQWKISS